MELNAQHQDWLETLLEEAPLDGIIEFMALTAEQNAQWELEESLSPSPEREAGWLQAAALLHKLAPKLRIAALERTTSS